MMERAGLSSSDAARPSLLLHSFFSVLLTGASEELSLLLLLRSVCCSFIVWLLIKAEGTFSNLTPASFAIKPLI